MKVLLLFPPQANPAMPHLGLPSLTGYLRKNGYEEVFQRDLNVEAYEKLLTPGSLENYLKRAESVLGRLQQYQKINGKLKTAANKIKQIEKAKTYLRDEITFSDPRRCKFTAETIQNAFFLINAASWPASLDFYDYRSPYPCNSFGEILKAVEEECIFNSFFQEDVYPFIEGLHPDLVGISVNYKSQIVPAFVLAKNIKKFLKTTHVTMGGNVITKLADSLKVQKEIPIFVDSFILYEGEEALLSLAQCIKRKKSLRQVPNLIYWEDEKVVETDLSFNTNINDLPTPDFEGLPLDLYLTPGPVIPLLTSRGCYWRRCAFCTHYFIYGESYREREVEKVLQDIVSLQKQCNSNAFFFVDEGIHPKRLKQISSRITKEGLDLCWTAETRMEEELITDNTLNVIKEGGCRMLQYGLESASQKVLSLMDKGTNPAVAEKILKKAHDVGIVNYVMFMFGFPGETLREAKRTIEFLKNNHNYIHVLAGEKFRLEMNSKIHKNPQAYGIRLRSNRRNTDLALEYQYKGKHFLTDKQINTLLSSEVFENYRKRGQFYPIFDRVHFLFAPRALIASHTT